MRRLTTKELTLAAILAAVYAILTLCLPAYGPIQIRFSEALTVLPFLFPAAIPGLAVGCLIANLLSPYGLLDVFCGTAATLLAALLTSKMPSRYLAPLPPVLCNGLIIGALIAFYETGFGHGFLPAFSAHAVTVAAGEMVACYGLGLLMLSLLPKIRPLRGAP